ncbi:hypothetical protein ACU6VJ_01110 [Sphaerotilus sulfidivorans]
MPSRHPRHVLHRTASRMRRAVRLVRRRPGSVATMLMLMGGSLLGGEALAQPKGANAQSSSGVTGETRLGRQVRVRYTEPVQPRSGWNGQIASFGAPQAASGRTPARLRGSTIAELPITARTRAYGRIETEMKTRRDEPGRALQVGAGAGLSWQVSNQTQLQVEVGTAPGQNRTQVSVMLQLQL